jgi:hypothetical protein
MSRDSLLTYLNDHLAGSIAAVELVELLVGTSPDSQSELYHRTSGFSSESSNASAARRVGCGRPLPG